jgi:polyhydroxyalkanoate synthesis regulator protein
MRMIVIRIIMTAHVQDITITIIIQMIKTVGNRRDTTMATTNIITQIISSVGSPLATTMATIIQLEEDTATMIMGVTEVFIHLTMHEPE